MAAVTLRIYDLSQGMARQLSPAILGKQIDAIWHTSVQVFDREYYFGGGICSDPPGMSPYGTPHSVEHMGQTAKTSHQFLNFLSQISPSFSMQSYHLLDNNCNNFSDAVCIFLLDKHIPQHILDLPSEALNSPLGPFIRPMIDQMQAAVTTQSMGHQVQLPTSSSLPTSSNLPTSPAYWKPPITLSKANRQAIQTKLHQQSPETFAAETPPTYPQLLQYALTTPDLQSAFPALDYLRLLALEQSHADKIVLEISNIANRFVLADDVPPIPCMMALRIFVNLFKHASTTTLMCKNPPAGDLVESACTSLEKDHPALRKTAALLLLNFSGAPRRHPNATPLTEDHIVRIAYAAVARLNHGETPKPDEATPLLQSIYILAEASPDIKDLISAFELSLDQYQDSASCSDRDTHEVAARVAKLLS